MNLAAVILAAGQGTRMRSRLPKVLHPLAGEPMVRHVLRAVGVLEAQPVVLVVGHGAEAVQQATADLGLAYALQEEQLGTGHAVLQTLPYLAGAVDHVVVGYGDMPLLQAETYGRLAGHHQASGATLTMLTVVHQDPMGFGRVVRGPDGRVAAVVEERDCTPEQRQIRELNCGVYLFQAEWLRARLPLVRPSPAKGEIYLTDLVGMAAAEGQPVEALAIEDPEEVLGVNTRVHLAQAEAALRRRINQRWMLEGVTLVDPESTYIQAEVVIGPDTVIWPQTYLLGQTTVGDACEIGPGSWVIDSQIGAGCRVFCSVLEGAAMADGSNIGPYSHLRRGARLGPGAHVGNFAELKNSTLGEGAKMGHFSYLGDAQVGPLANIGAGTITCNFDGRRKHPTVIEEGAFIGSDTMLVAPVKVGRGAKTGAGAVVTRDVPAGALAYGVPARVRRAAESEEQGEE
ncbi:MAG: bifunctional UDP-N-acetylglucosamine diphosphorylase/glucosamine-1-phosphate N-acetyltransferase GlmU [Chloroflexi bacterium]|nr:bifunctional UDP-N-acetylglucosamine diphosphorylase/glucosamine-1-phosphate N-acetyltransferase GlmU [Chloroflexota bacterium]